MMRIQDFPNKSNLINFILLWTVISLIVPIPSFGEDFQKQSSYFRTTQARLAVEKAWDTYHDGALGGTLKSPKSQTKLEMDLHKSRTLLAEAYDAEDRGDKKTVNKLIYKIMQITRSVINESQEPKK
jgi:hypothetical protein